MDGNAPLSFAFGMKPDSFNLYEGPSKCRCCQNWVKEYPDDLKESLETAEGPHQYALLVRHRKSHQKYSAQPLELDSVVINSPLIKPVLEEVFEAYPGVTVDLDKLTFESPFAPFLHRWVRFEEALASNLDRRTLSHLNVL